MFTNKLDMHSQLKIPFAGYRSANDASVYELGNSADLWSSSPNSASSPYSRRLYLGVDDDMFFYHYASRDDARSVRCFYDKYEAYPSTFMVTFLNDGVEVRS